jgi:type VI secretion system protein
MSLKLTVISYQGPASVKEATKTIDRGDATIGRATGNDWVLPDPEKVLSKTHCRIQYRGDGYYLTDTSTNGVFINRAEQRLQRGQTVKLSDGDIITMGKYDIQVNITETAASSGKTGVEAGEFTDLLDLRPEYSPPFTVTPTADSLCPGAALDIESSAAKLLIPEDVNLLNLESPPPVLPTQPDNLPPEMAFFRAPEPATAAPSEIPGHWGAEDDEFGPTTRPDAVSAGHRPEQPVQPSAMPVSKTPVPQAPLSPLQDGYRAALEAFLEGAGLTPQQVPIAEADIPELMNLLGKMFRQTVQGLWEVLMARSSIKREIGTHDLTMVCPTDNNPLKFSASVEEAMNHLLIPQVPAYLLPLQALEEGFNDIRAHEFALWAGMQAALTDLLRHFDPKVLETYIGRSMLNNIMPHTRKSRFWDLFTARYNEIVREAEGDFRELFSREFARAYEEQVRRLKS